MKTQLVYEILWNNTSSKINIINNDFDGKARFIQNDVWLYYDNVNGYQLMSDDKISFLSNDFDV